MGNHTNFIMRTLHLLRQLNEHHLKIDQISDFDCLPEEISIAERQEMQAAAEGLRWVEDYTHFIHDESFGDIFYVFWGDSSGKRKYQKILQNRILMDALEKARVAVRARKTFLSQISHETRTPLNAILGFTALAKTSLHDSDKLSKYLDQVEVASHHLLDMITETLEVPALQSAEESIHEGLSSTFPISP